MQSIFLKTIFFNETLTYLEKKEEILTSVFIKKFSSLLRFNVTLTPDQGLWHPYWRNPHDYQIL